MAVFVSAVAQTDNIGDVVIRRELISWLRSSGRELQVLTAILPPEFVEALDLEAGEACQSQRAWLGRFFRDCLRGRAALCFPPGMQPMVSSRAAYLRAVLHLVMAVCCRARGGAVVKVGRSIEGDSRGLLTLERLLRRVCHLYVLRDLRSPEVLGVPARTAPDLGVASPSMATRPAVAQPEPRAVAMSWRADSPVPSAVVTGIHAELQRAGFESVLVTQVRRDGERHEQLANALGCRHVDWPDEVSHADQEVRVADAYAGCAAVVPDRLHALVLGWNEGAVPLGYCAPGDRKIWNHLGRMGLDALLIRSDGAPADLGALLERRELSDEARRLCHAELAELRYEVVDLLGD